MWRSLGLTAAILALAGVALDRLALSFVHVGPPWLGSAPVDCPRARSRSGHVFLAAPTASLVASFYLDDIAALVEQTVDPNGPGAAFAAGAVARDGLRFAVLSIVVNVVVLALTIFTGVGLAAFFVLNGYLLGREYLRAGGDAPCSAAQARSLFLRHWHEVFMRASSSPAWSPCRS